jgi:hypothetical protein
VTWRVQLLENELEAFVFFAVLPRRCGHSTLVLRSWNATNRVRTASWGGAPTPVEMRCVVATTQAFYLCPASLDWKCSSRIAAWQHRWLAASCEKGGKLADGSMPHQVMPDTQLALKELSFRVPPA